MLEAGSPGGQMHNTADVENYPGYALISGPELAEKMFEPLENLGVEHVFGHVQRIEDQGGSKKVIPEDEVYESKTVIIATGDLLVVGGGDSAVEEAIFLTQFAKSVTIVHRRDQLRAQKVLQDRAFANEKISFVWDSVVEAIHGDERKVTGVTFKNIKTGETSQADFGGIFIYVGLDPVSEFVADLGIRDESGWIVTDDHMKTSVAGIYAIGDVRQKDLRQITTAVGDGAIAGQEAYKYITEHE